MKTFRKIMSLAIVLMMATSVISVAAVAESTQEPYTCVILSVGPDANSADCELVSEAASAITIPKYNTTIKVIRYGYGSYAEQQNLMLASGEKLDLMASFALTPGTGANNGQILALDDLLATDGKDLLAQIPESDWLCTSIDGKIYGVRNNKELATGYGYAVLTSVMDSIGVDASTIKTEEDFNALLEKVKAAYPDMWPIASDNGTCGWFNEYYDELGGDFGILEDCTTDSTTVVNRFATESWYNTIEQRYQWVQKGLMMPDGSTVSESANKLIGAGKVFSRYINTKPGIEGEVKADAGVDVTVIPMTSSFSCTSHLSNMWYIPWQSEQPARAMQILNEIYTNAELSNILINGVEGVHWTLIDEANGVIDYADGVTAASTGYAPAAWSWPNELITYVWNGVSPTVWSETIAYNENAINSPAKGYTWNNANVLSEIAACNNVCAKYKNALECGELDPAVYVPMFLDELQKAGVDTIIAEKQAQLDAWMASK